MYSLRKACEMKGHLVIHVRFCLNPGLQEVFHAAEPSVVLGRGLGLLGLRDV